MQHHTGHLQTAMRVVEWNRARYDRIWNTQLAVKLLLEETDELFSAPTKRDMLDAIGDIAFVAIGCYWKMGFDPADICKFIHSANLAAMDSATAFSYMYFIEEQAMQNPMITNQNGTFPGLSLASHSLFITALGQLRGLGMQYLFYDILRAICDSNDTKEIKGKTAAHIKANVVKGAGYVPPTKDLQFLIDNHDILKRDLKEVGVN